MFYVYLKRMCILLLLDGMFYVYMCVHLCMCMYVCVYIYIHTQIYIYICAYVSLKATGSLLIFCLDDLYIDVSGVFSSVQSLSRV